MEKFYVFQGGMVKEGESEIIQQPGFWLTVVSMADREAIPALVRPDAPGLVREWLERVEAKGRQLADRKHKNEGFLGVYPRAERLGPEHYYVCYRDMDQGGKERAIRFFLTPKEFVLWEWGDVEPEQLKAWAKRGLLACSMHLAQVLGARILFHHQELLEKFEDQMDIVEEGILKGPKIWQEKKIMDLHKRVIGLKKSLNAHQSVFIRLGGVGRMEGPGDWQELVQDTQRELDNVRQTHELLESLREAYQTALDNRANDIMKVLTLLATFLLPINLLTSFFGMNFENMPLIHTNYGIWFFYGVSGMIMGISLWYFHKKKWQK